MRNRTAVKEGVVKIYRDMSLCLILLQAKRAERASDSCLIGCEIQPDDSNSLPEESCFLSASRWS